MPYTMEQYNIKKQILGEYWAIKKKYKKHLNLLQFESQMHTLKFLSEELEYMINDNPILLTDYVKFLESLEGRFCSNIVFLLSIENWVKFSNIEENDPFNYCNCETSYQFTQFDNFISDLAQLGSHAFGEDSPEIKNILNLYKEILKDGGN